MASTATSRVARGGLRKEEAIGLVVAIALHAAVLAVLLLRPARHEVVKPPQRIEVTISDEVGMTSTSPDPFSPAAPDSGPQPGEPAPEPAPAPAPVAAIEPAPAPMPPAPAPRAIETPRPQPRPAPKAPPKAVQKPAPKPAPSRKASAIDRIVAKPPQKTAPKSGPKSSPKAAAPSRSAATSKNSATPRKAGSSAFDDAFKQGTPGAKSSTGSGAPAAAIGAKQLSALNAAVSRQLKPKWQAPQGADAELLVTRVRFRLNPDGSLSGEPQVLSTSGQTDANKTQVQRHQEQAIRAVKLAAPFNLPDELYEGWKVVTTNFDRRLSQ